MATKTNTVYFRNVGGKDFWWSASVASTDTPAWPVGATVVVDGVSAGTLAYGQTGSVVVAVTNGSMLLANEPYNATLSLRVYSDAARTKLAEIEEVSIRVDITGNPSLALTGTLSYRFTTNQGYPETFQCTLQNDGDLDLTWVASAAGDAALNGMITITPNSGALIVLGVQVLDVEVDPAGAIANGIYQQTLTATGTPGGEATLPIDVEVTALWTGNIKFHASIPAAAPNFVDGTLVFASPGNWAGSFFPLGTWLYFQVNTAGAVTRIDAFPLSPRFELTFRLADGYPSGQSAWWNGFWGMPTQITVGPNVW